MSSSRRSKLDWYKSLRGADLTPAEAYVLILLVGYSDADRGNAHPSTARLAEDSGMTGRGVQKILKRLEAKKAIVVTEEGGNQVRKGAATVYRILTPPQRPKGDTHVTLQSAKGEPPFTLPDSPKGEPPFTLEDDTKGEPGVQPRVNPRSPHQVIHQGLRAAAPKTALPAPLMSRKPTGLLVLPVLMR